MRNKLVSLLFGSRLSPGLCSPGRMHLLSIRKYLQHFIKKYVKDQMSVLDFGCGNMPYKILFEGKTINYQGVDIGDSPEKNDNYLSYNGGKVPLKDDMFDIVISTNAFEHLDDPYFYGRELERLTKDGGYICLTIAHVREYHPYPKHYFNLMYDGVEKIFQNSKIIDVKSDTSEFVGILQYIMKRASKRKIGYFLVFFLNFTIYFFELIGIKKAGPVKFNPYGGIILLTLKVNKA